ncbi:MAG: hypothetical protein CMJ18_02140 [Phycisphaeraceae bacterium]|nr:hypothetical protein [Phycisphaeraceae bacterium]
MSSPHRVAVVGGAGVWGRRYMRAYADRPDCRIVALVDRAAGRRDAFARHFGAESVYDDVAAMLADQVPDIVSLVLPVAVSPGVVMTCARAGVRVVSCEKPIATSLQEADEMIRICRACGTMLGCSTAYWEGRHLLATARYLLDEKPLGRITAASIPAGVEREVAGAGCVAFSLLALFTGMTPAWVEGHALPSWERYTWPTDVAACEIDSGVYGRIGMSEGVVCDIPDPSVHPLTSYCPLSVTFEEGRLWLQNYRNPVIIRGWGPASAPLWLHRHWEDGGVLVPPAVARLVHALETGEPVICDCDDMRRAHEVAIALKQSAHDGNRRVDLPLVDRSARILPHAHRLHGGDRVGWENTHYEKPPDLEASGV